jgi:hypothetical protein
MKIFNEDDTTTGIQEELDKLPKYQSKLISADIARSVLHFYEDKHPNNNQPRLAIEAAELLKYDSLISAVAWSAGCDAYGDNDNNCSSALAAFAAAAAAWSCFSCDDNYSLADASVIVKATQAGQSWEFINNICKYAYNINPFPNEWKTNDTLNIANNIIVERDFSSTPILADALEDAGCTDDALLNHLRNDILGLSDWVLFSLRQDAL